jgi:hypothetical protein
MEEEIGNYSIQKRKQKKTKTPTMFDMSKN